MTLCALTGAGTSDASAVMAIVNQQTKDFITYRASDARQLDVRVEFIDRVVR